MSLVRTVAVEAPREVAVVAEEAELVTWEALALEPVVEPPACAQALPVLAATAPDVVDAQKLADGLGAAGAPVAVSEQDLGSQ
jgi:hypothetical protein